LASIYFLRSQTSAPKLAPGENQTWDPGRSTPQGSIPTQVGFLIPTVTSLKYYSLSLMLKFPVNNYIHLTMIKNEGWLVVGVWRSLGMEW